MKLSKMLRSIEYLVEKGVVSADCEVVVGFDLPDSETMSAVSFDLMVSGETDENSNPAIILAPLGLVDIDSIEPDERLTLDDIVKDPN